MAKTIDELRSAAAVVRDASEEHENTALRVGQLLIEMIETLGKVQFNGIKGFVAISSVNDLPESPSREEQQKGYLLDTTLYVWTGTGGDTLDGKYRSVQLKGADGAPGAQGPKGDSGVDLGEVVLVNDLTTGGEGNALSAEMGKKLKGMVDESMRTEEGEIINLADLTGKVKGVYEGGTLVTAGYWPMNSSSIKVAVEPSTAYLIGPAFYGGSIPRFIGEWDENGNWLRDAVANDVGIEGSDYTHLKNNLAYIKTSDDAHYISIAYLTSAYSASDLAPTMVVKASRMVMPSEYVEYGVRDNGAMNANSVDSFEKA